MLLARTSTCPTALPLTRTCMIGPTLPASEPLVRMVRLVVALCAGALASKAQAASVMSVVFRADMGGGG